MRSFIIFSALIVAAYGGVILTHGGVPLDTPAVASAKAAHFAAYDDAVARNAHAEPAHGGHDFGHGGHGVVYGGHGDHGVVYGGHGFGHGGHAIAHAAPAVHHAPAIVHAPAVAHFAAPESLTYAVPPAFGLPVVDTPEVASAKVYHAAAHHEAKARNLLGYPVAATGYLADTPDVAAAKVAHSASYHDAVVRNSPIFPDHGYAYGVHGYAGHHLKAHY